MEKLYNELLAYVKSKFTLLFVNTVEIERATAELCKFRNWINQQIKNFELPYSVKEYGFTCYIWNMIHGLVKYNYLTYEDEFSPDGVDKKTIDIINALEEVQRDEKLAGFYIFKNADLSLATKYGNSGRIPYVTHLLGSYKSELQEQLKWIIFIGNIENIPEEIKQLFIMVDFELPNEEEIKDYVLTMLAECMVDIEDKNKINAIVNACKGMTLNEIDEALRLGIIEGRYRDVDLKCIYKAKSNAVKKSSFLEYIDTNFGIEKIGGMSLLKNEVQKISKIYSNIDKALEFGLTMPKGYLLVGIAGTGKTLASKAIAKELNLPLYRADIGALFGGIVGETERNTREFFKLIKAVSPAVIQIDEIEKAFSGSQSSGYTDGGVTDRLIGSFLTYMQERDYPCFFVATCNDIKSLPAPFVRKGRWDEIFFIDLPNIIEREEIVKIHIQNTGRDWTKFNITELASISENLTGAEIENAIQEALKIAFYEDREVKQEDFVKTIKNTKGIALLKSEEITYLREWAKDRAKFANSINTSLNIGNKKRKSLL